jgi:hypothetical protein
VGGFGSGCYGRTVTAEATASYVFTISSLRPFLGKGQCLSAITLFDEGKFLVAIRLDTANLPNAFVELSHKTRDDREGDRIVTDRIQLTWTTPTYGGRRWWFRCPRTYCKATKLYLPNGGWHFWSRQAYGLGYACQREDRFGRLQRRAAMLNRQLGGEGWETWDMPPQKPKWMRWRTYEQKYERWKRAVEKANDEFTVRAMRILRRPIR